MKIALVEGLASFRIGYVRKALARELIRAGHQVSYHPWTTKTKSHYDVCIAHSFGAGYAVHNELHCDILITLDARRWDFWNNWRMERPDGVSAHYNFFQQRSFLKGYPINKAVNRKVYCSHVGLPEHVKKQVLAIIEKY